MFTYGLSDLLAMPAGQRAWAISQSSIQSEAIYAGLAIKEKHGKFYSKPWERYSHKKPIRTADETECDFTQYRNTRHYETVPDISPFPSPSLPTAREAAEKALVEAFIAIRKRRSVTRQIRYRERLAGQPLPGSFLDRIQRRLAAEAA